MPEPFTDGFNNVKHGDLRGDIVMPADQMLRNVVGEVEVRQPRQRRVSLLVMLMILQWCRLNWLASRRISVSPVTDSMIATAFYTCRC